MRASSRTSPEPDGVEWDKRTKLTFEKEILKMYVSDHPLSPYENYLSRTNKYSMTELNEREESIKNIKCAGMVSDVNVKRTKRNTLMATFNLEDLAGSIECICFPNYEKVSSVLEEDAGGDPATVRGKFEVSDRANQLIGYEIEKLELTEEQQNVKPVLHGAAGAVKRAERAFFSAPAGHPEDPSRAMIRSCSSWRRPTAAACAQSCRSPSMRATIPSRRTCTICSDARFGKHRRGAAWQTGTTTERGGVHEGRSVVFIQRRAFFGLRAAEWAAYGTREYRRCP